ncbi:MAG: 50S ribosomal protein L18 [Nitrososphaerota archaeon]
MTYVHTLKRIREKKTNYHKRSSLLQSKQQFITVKLSNQNVLTQLLEPNIAGDKVIAFAHSTNLEGFGWKGSNKSLPACYLTGLLLGKKASFKGIENAVLYTGRDTFTPRTAACLKGIIDGGIKVPSSEKSFPGEDRLSGEHISSYAFSLKGNKDQYMMRFSNIIKKGLEPENYKTHFEEIKNKISNLSTTDFEMSSNNKDKIADNNS